MVSLRVLDVKMRHHTAKKGRKDAGEVEVMRWRLIAVVTPRQAKKGSWTKEMRSKEFSTKEEAEAGKTLFAHSFDPNWNPSNTPQTTKRKRSVANLQAFKRVKREMKWANLTLRDWEEHPDLKDKRVLEDIPHLLAVKLDGLFRRGKRQTALTKSCYDHLRHLNGQIERLESRASSYREKAGTLGSLVRKGKAYSLLRVRPTSTTSLEDKDEEVDLLGLEKSSQRKEADVTENKQRTSRKETADGESEMNTSFSEAQRNRASLQALVVAEMYILHASKDADSAAWMRREADALVEAAQRREDDQTTSGTDLKTIQAEYAKARENAPANDQLAEKVVKSPLFSDAKLSKRIVRGWFTAFLKNGCFEMDGRGK